MSIDITTPAERKAFKRAVDLCAAQAAVLQAAKAWEANQDTDDLDTLALTIRALRALETPTPEQSPSLTEKSQ